MTASVAIGDVRTYSLVNARDDLRRWRVSRLGCARSLVELTMSLTWPPCIDLDRRPALVAS
jgi:hypothetical protein